jgi:hypothetical protein
VAAAATLLVVAWREAPPGPRLSRAPLDFGEAAMTDPPVRCDSGRQVEQAWLLDGGALECQSELDSSW